MVVVAGIVGMAIVRWHDNGRNRLIINKCGGSNFELAVMVEGFNCHVRCGGALVAVKWGMSGGDGIIAVMLVAGLSSNEGGRVVMGLVHSCERRA